MGIRAFVNLTSRAWALTILSLLHEGVPGRQALLLAKSGASRTAFAQSLRHLVELGMLERNPGHGHPLRPEYRLTGQGAKAAKLAHQIQQVAKPEDQFLLRRAWTLPILTTLQKPGHFNDIKRILPMITDRALSQSLKSMEDRAWVQRSVNDLARPPRSLYSAINTGKKLSEIAAVNVDLDGL